MEQMVKSDEGMVLECEEGQKPKKKRKSTTSSTQEHANVGGKPKRRLRKEKDRVKGSLPYRKYGKLRHPCSKRVGSYAEMLKNYYRVNIPVNAPDTKDTISKKEKHGAAMNHSTDLTNLNGTEQSRCDTMCIPNLGLRKEDEKILQNRHAWLNNSLINSSHNLLGKQFPNTKGSRKLSLCSCKKITPMPINI